MIEYLIPILLTLASLILLSVAFAHAMYLGFQAGAREMARETREYLERHTDEAGA